MKQSYNEDEDGQSGPRNSKFKNIYYGGKCRYREPGDDSKDENGDATTPKY